MRPLVTLSLSLSLRYLSVCLRAGEHAPAHRHPATGTRARAGGQAGGRPAGRGRAGREGGSEAGARTAAAAASACTGGGATMARSGSGRDWRRASRLDKIVGFHDGTRLATLHTQFRDAWAPHTQTQMHGVRRWRYAPINLYIGWVGVAGTSKTRFISRVYTCSRDSARSALLTAIRNRRSGPCRAPPKGTTRPCGP